MRDLFKLNIIILTLLIIVLLVSSVYLGIKYIWPLKNGSDDSIGSGNACTLIFTVKKQDLKNMSVACSNTFLNNEDNESLNENSRLKPDNLVKIRVLLNNTGEVPLNDLSLESPLDSIYASKGAKNLSWFQFYGIADTSSPGIKDKCTYSKDFNSIQCRNLSIPYTEELYIDYIVKVKGVIESDSDIVNVSKVFVEGTGVDYYCNSSIKTAVISTVCNNSTQSCEKVYRAPLEGESVCGSSSDCGALNSSTHLECFENACISVDGEGLSTCSDNNDCISPSHLECSGLACTLVDGSGTNTCATDTDCNPQTHFECKNNACTSVSGSGVNTCSVDNDCKTDTHLECFENACISVNGSAKDTCALDTDCSTSTHLECVGESCLEVAGGGFNQCSSSSECSTNVAIPAPDPNVDPNEDVPSTGISLILYGIVVSLSGMFLSYLTYKYVRFKK